MSEVLKPLNLVIPYIIEMIEFMSLFSECKLLPKPKAISLPSPGRVFCEMFHSVHVRGICIKQSKNLMNEV